MGTARCWIIGWLLLAVGPAAGEELPRDEVRLRPARWRATRQVVQQAAEQAGFRWAMPATVSRKAFTGSAEGKATPAGELLRDLAKKTGLTAEMLNGVVVVHEPAKETARWVGNLAGDEQRQKLVAIAELGWSRDVRAWPALTRTVVGADLELALAAAQALRRLEGEKALDWRLHGLSAEDPEFVPMSDPVAPWQAPLGSLFPDTVPAEAVERLASSTYLPLREAGARLTAALGPKGQPLCRKLADDPSPLVRVAADRTLAAWARPKKGEPKPTRKPSDSKPWWEQPPPDLKLAARQLAEAKEHDTVWRLLGRRVAYESSPEAIRVMLEHGKSGTRWSHIVSRPLAEFCGGPEVVAWLKDASAKGELYYDHQQGWALWGLSALQDGEALAHSLRPALEGRAFWAAPVEFTAASGAGRHALPLLLARMETRGHWVCRALGYVGGPEAADALIAQLGNPDPGVAVAAAKGLGDLAALAGVRPLIEQLRHEDRLRRHWVVLGLGRIGGPDAARALTELLAVEEKRQDRLVRKAAAELLKELGPLGEEARKRIARFEQEDHRLVPEYRPRNPRFGEEFPVNTEVVVKEHRPVTYSSIGETRAALDWANRLLFRYGGCSPCYSNEFFAFDVGTGTWFPIRAADHYCDLLHEIRPNPGCSRGMTYDGVNKLVWIGRGIGASTGPTQVSHNRGNGLAAYDAALDRFLPCVNAMSLAQPPYTGEPAKALAFDGDTGLVLSSKSSGQGIGLVEAATRKTFLDKAPDKMPSWDQYRPPAFAYDPVARKLFCTHPDLGWKLLAYDRQANSYRLIEAPLPGKPSKQIMGGLVYDSLNRALILVGGVSKETGTMPTCAYDREKERWIDLEARNLGQLGVGQGTCVFDPEHNVILEPIRGAAYRYRKVPPGTRAFLGGGIGTP